METVAEHLVSVLENGFATRLEKLKEMKAPEILITRVEDDLTFILSHDVKTVIKEFVDCKEPELFDAIFVSSETKIGNGGKPYSIYQTSVGELNYFPNARFGRFLKRKT